MLENLTEYLKNKDKNNKNKNDQTLITKRNSTKNKDPNLERRLKSIDKAPRVCFRT